MRRTSLIITVLLLCVPLTTAGTPTELDPTLVETAERYLEAYESHDVEALEQVLADDARRYFGEREGEGMPLEPGEKGPWHAWDEFFHSESEVVEWTQPSAGVVRAGMREINDWFRLMDRPPTRYFISFSFDDNGRIEWLLIHSDPDSPKNRGRVEEFEAWARAERPGLLDRLQPGGEIDPSKFEEWKSALLEWRHDAGLPNPLRRGESEEVDETPS